MERAEVAVVGGGVAGLAALAALEAAGCDAVLLEARERLGGRIWTLHPEAWPAPVELGAEFIHGGPEELRASTSRPSAGVDWTRSDGQLRRAGEFGQGAWSLLARMAALRPPAPDRSFAAFLDQCGDAAPPARAAALGYIEGFEAADPARISVHSLIREREATDDDRPWPLRPRDGYGRLVEAMAAAANPRVWLGTLVETVTWRPGGVEIAARRAGTEVRLRARRVILTLPLSLLQQSLTASPAVRFEPPLAAKRAALAQLVMGGALRITLRLRQAFWTALRDADGRRLEDLRFLFGPTPATGHFATWWTMPGAPQITGWAAGRHAWALEGEAPDALRQRAVGDLGERLGVPASAIEPLLIAAHLHDWQSDPHSRGGYSYAAVGGADAFAALAAPLDQTLYFAGEATDNTGQHATVQGALRSGRRAAREVLAD